MHALIVSVGCAVSREPSSFLFDITFFTDHFFFYLRILIIFSYIFFLFECDGVATCIFMDDLLHYYAELRRGVTVAVSSLPRMPSPLEVFCPGRLCLHLYSIVAFVCWCKNDSDLLHYYTELCKIQVS